MFAKTDEWLCLLSQMDGSICKVRWVAISTKVKDWMYIQAKSITCISLYLSAGEYSG